MTSAAISSGSVVTGGRSKVVGKVGLAENGVLTLLVPDFGVGMMNS
jgi:hypothetical protein